jgi:hypothetical protein
MDAMTTSACVRSASLVKRPERAYKDLHGCPISQYEFSQRLQRRSTSSRFLVRPSRAGICRCSLWCCYGVHDFGSSVTFGESEKDGKDNIMTDERADICPVDSEQSVSSCSEGSRVPRKRLSFFERYLSRWVALCNGGRGHCGQILH